MLEFCIITGCQKKSSELWINFTHHHLQDLPHSITVDRVIHCCLHINPVIAQLQGYNHIRDGPGGHGLDLHFYLVGALFAGGAANMFSLHELKPCLKEKSSVEQMYQLTDVLLCCVWKCFECVRFVWHLPFVQKLRRCNRHLCLKIPCLLVT